MNPVPGDATSAALSTELLRVAAGNPPTMWSCDYYVLESSGATEILSGAAGQGFDAGVTGCQKGRDRLAAGFADDVAVRFGHLVDQPVGA